VQPRPSRSLDLDDRVGRVVPDVLVDVDVGVDGKPVELVTSRIGHT
jgi:hypothetical protein